MLELKVEKRDKIGKASKRRAGGGIPGVFYGRKEDSTPITLSAHDFKRVWKEAGESTVISLTGIGEEKEALIHEVDLDPVSWEPRHVDFYIIEKGKKVTVEVPIEFIGTAPAEKELGGVVVKVLHELEIEVLPKDLPHSIEVDLSFLKDFDSKILVKNVNVPEGVTVLAEPEEVVANVSEVKEEAEETSETPDLESIEVEQKGKKEEDGAEAGAESAGGEEQKENKET